MPGHPLGLTEAEATERLARYGANALAEPPRRGFVSIMLEQFRDVMVLILLAAMTLAGILGDPADVIAIGIIVVLNASLGAMQQYRAERTLAALRAMGAPTARVRRDAVVRVIPSAGVVPDDALLLEAGNIVAADCRLVEAPDLAIDEAALTGESLPVAKSVTWRGDAGAPVGDRANMAFAGTTVARGRGEGIVVATGARTQFGLIAASLGEATPPPTPLQRRLGRLGRQLSIGVLFVAAVVFVVGVVRGGSPSLMLMTAMSLAVAAVPEGLPIVVTIALALGARRLARRNALARRLSAVETLGSVNTICADKTGTLTENRMRVEQIRASGALDMPVAPGEARAMRPALLEAMAISNDVTVGPGGQLGGDPTETALCAAAARAGVERASTVARLRRIAELPFSSERARMTTLHGDDAAAVAYTKGAPERVLPLCTNADGVALDRAVVFRAAQAMAESGLRVLAIATRRFDALPAARAPNEIERDLTFLGLVGIIDPPRAGVAESIAECHTAGIRVVMITGDHPTTALAIAKRLGLASSPADVLTGRNLPELSDEALAEHAANIRVFARVTPSDKLRLVRALQAKGSLVAMTGDGVNDAPALRQADVGVAMGRGTDVAREAAALVLVDDNLPTIVSAVREGRRIHDNILKFLRYILGGNAGEVLTLLVAPLFGLPLPLLPTQLLWVNLVTDGLPGLALVAEPEEPGVMRRKPSSLYNSFGKDLWVEVCVTGVILGAAALGTQAWALRGGSPHAGSMAFTTLTLAQMAQVLSVRAGRWPLYRQIGANWRLLLVIALTVALQMAVLYVRPLQRLFHTQPLSWSEIGVIALAAGGVLVLLELRKLALLMPRLAAGRAEARG